MRRHTTSSRASMLVVVMVVVVPSLIFSSPTATPAAGSVEATLVAPPDASTTPTSTPTLSVIASDPEGGRLDVTFEGRRAGATVPVGSDADPFSVVVLPDTQNYSYANQAVLETQLEWVRDSVDELGTAFTLQVGDLVSEWNIPHHWQSVSRAFEILDRAAVPYTVLPGNHDFDNTSADMSEFNSSFPPARFARAAWNSGSTRYGGYLGEHRFGEDPIDRGNADNYALFTAGGVDFLVLNLEWEAPAYALDWADRVLDVYPDRTVIMATHSFLTVDGLRLTTPQRSGGTSTAALWNDFVSTHCQVRLVVSGHFSDSRLGEAHRTDVNACGQPVQQILTNYQGRPNGGDGWLRYYTFDPAANTLRATTYSPHLDRFETDADSDFTLPFPLVDEKPAPFVPIDTLAIRSGGVASTDWSGLAPDATYEWRAVVDDGTTRTVSPAWTLRTPPAPQTVLASDAFERTMASGWGTADIGGAWTPSLGSSDPLTVDGGSGRMTLMPGQTRMVALESVSTTDAVVDVQVSTDVASSGSAAHTTIIGRLVGTSSYGFNLRFEPDGMLRAHLVRDGTGLGMQVYDWSPGTPLSARLSVTGTAPTRLAAKVWPSAQPEPASWQLLATDGATALQAAGGIAIRSSVGEASTVPTTTLAFDALRVVAADPVDPPQPMTTARIAGADRYATSVAISRAMWWVGDTVFLASGSKFPDALSAGPVAAAERAHLLLTRRDALPDAVATRLLELAPREVVLVGDQQSISDAVARQLAALMPATVLTRVAGVNRYETALDLLERRAEHGAITEVWVVAGSKFPDALVAGSVAGRHRGVIVLDPNRSSAAGIAEWAGQVGDIAGGLPVRIAGSEASVSRATELALRRAGAASVERYAGADRYRTARAIHDAFSTAISSRMLLATGRDFPDALGGALLAASTGEPLYLAPSTCNSDIAAMLRAERDERRIDGVLGLGGSPSLSDRVLSLEHCAGAP